MDGSTEMREIQKRYIKNIRMDLDSEQKAPLLAPFLSFGTGGERTENRGSKLSREDFVKDSILHTAQANTAVRNQRCPVFLEVVLGIRNLPL